jgi:hypothetical protein
MVTICTNGSEGCRAATSLMVMVGGLVGDETESCLESRFRRVVSSYR